MKKTILTVLAAMLLVLPATLAAQQENFPHVPPPHSVVAGKTLGEWSAMWWKWAYAIPANDNPLLDPSGEKSKFGDVGPFFLAGLFNTSGSVTRTVTIPANKFIFFPLENLVNDNVGVTPRQTIDTLVSQIDAALPGITALHASIDGREVGDLSSHREAAPVFSYTLQLTDNLQQVVNGITTRTQLVRSFPQ
jgi:hypothetical protein